MLLLVARLSYEEEIVFCFFFLIFKLMLDRAISNTPKTRTRNSAAYSNYSKVLLIAIH